MDEIVAYHLEASCSGEVLATADTPEAMKEALDALESRSGPGTGVLAACTGADEALFIPS